MAPSPCIFIPSFLRAKIRTGQFRQKRNSKLVMLAALLFPGDRLEKHGHKLLLKTETGAYLHVTIQNDTYNVWNYYYYMYLAFEDLKQNPI